jgi:hypothetical protein
MISLSPDIRRAMPQRDGKGHDYATIRAGFR